MDLLVYLRSGAPIEVPGFEEISYFYNDRVRITPEKIEKLVFIDSVTYSFKGGVTINVKGSDILYIQLSK